MNYRSSVGPADKYDLIGAKQFCVLVDQGLREHHYLLDIGCGSIRGGKLFIPYLQTGHYFGIEPNANAVNEGIEKELGTDFVFKFKKASFYFSDQFDIYSGFVGIPARFDFILAQSIFSHTSRAQTEKCITQARLLMNGKSKFLGTWFEGPHNYEGEGWKQGPVVTRPKGYLEGIAKEKGLSFEKLGYKHPSGQTWFLMRVQQ